MHAAPAVQVSIQRCAAWRVALLGLGAVDVAATAAWLLGREQPIDTTPMLLATLACTAIVVWGLSLLSGPVAKLRWDGLQWHLAPLDSAADGAVRGECRVALDLGSWMMLRFVPDRDNAQCRTTWLPIRRGAVPNQWHALRCALLAHRSAAAADAPGGP